MVEHAELLPSPPTFLPSHTLLRVKRRWSSCQFLVVLEKGWDQFCVCCHCCCFSEWVMFLEEILRAINRQKKILEKAKLIYSDRKQIDGSLRGGGITAKGLGTVEGRRTCSVSWLWLLRLCPAVKAHQPVHLTQANFIVRKLCLSKVDFNRKINHYESHHPKITTITTLVFLCY